MSDNVLITQDQLDLLTQELIADEGVRYSAYQDQFGFWTIGVGFLIDERNHGRIPQVVLQFWLDYLLRECYNDIAQEPWYRACTSPVQCRGLLNMRFQLGSSGIRTFKTSLGLIAQGKFAEAGANLRKSNWYKETPARAERVIRMIENG